MEIIARSIFLVAQMVNVFFTNGYSIDELLTLGDHNQITAEIIGKDIKIDLEIAKSQEKLQRGLMFRESLPENTGMLFIFEQERVLSFWMENTKLSLDMIFINSRGEIVTIHEETVPYQRSPLYISDEPAQLVIEVIAGYSEENNIEVGDLVLFR